VVREDSKSILRQEVKVRTRLKTSNKAKMNSRGKDMIQRKIGL
jgi:hypothetical protein